MVTERCFLVILSLSKDYKRLTLSIFGEVLSPPNRMGECIHFQWLPGTRSLNFFSLDPLGYGACTAGSDLCSGRVVCNDEWQQCKKSITCIILLLVWEIRHLPFRKSACLLSVKPVNVNCAIYILKQYTSLLHPQSSFRPINVSLPSMLPIVEMQLCAGGFSFWHSLSRRLSAFLDRLSLWLADSLPAGFHLETLSRVATSARDLLADNIRGFADQDFYDSFEKSKQVSSHLWRSKPVECIVLFFFFFLRWKSWFSPSNSWTELESQPGFFPLFAMCCSPFFFFFFFFL